MIFILLVVQGVREVYVLRVLSLFGLLPVYLHIPPAESEPGRDLGHGPSSSY